MSTKNNPRKRKTCPGCKKSYVQRYFTDHRQECYVDGNWTCKKITLAVPLLVANDEPAIAQMLPENVMEIEIETPPVHINDLDNENINIGTTAVSSNDDETTDCLEGFFDTDISEDSDESEEDEFSQITEEWFHDPEASTSEVVIGDQMTTSFAVLLLLWQAIFKIPNNAIHIVIKMLNVLFNSIGNGLQFPSSLYTMRKYLGLTNDSFEKYVVCPKCVALYKFKDCVQRVEGKNISKLCSNIPFGYHRQQHRRHRCNEQLLEETTTPAGKPVLRPFKVYCYNSIKQCLQVMVKRNNFENNCETWRSIPQHNTYLNDIYDGLIWRKFMDNGFFKERDYGFILNLDWFQPFKHTEYSIGVLYLVNCNLPPNMRFKRENIFLVGIIPHFRHLPPINSFLQPLVDELQEAWTDGFYLKSYSSPNEALVCTL